MTTEQWDKFVSKYQSQFAQLCSEIAKEMFENFEEEEEEEVRCVCEFCFGEGVCHVSKQRATELNEKGLMEQNCPFGDKCSYDKEEECTDANKCGECTHCARTKVCEYCGCVGGCDSSCRGDIVFKCSRCDVAIILLDQGS